MTRDDIVKALDEKVKAISQKFEVIEEDGKDLVLVTTKPYKYYIAWLDNWETLCVDDGFTFDGFFELNSSSWELNETTLTKVIRLFLREAKLLTEALDND